ncbi:MAG TPA: HPr family phosphocarrier protein [Desulfosalsimonadaceae bacterium]|nr:HPr family phosphocarrier protein [Desulfosalsimonadaceae bacterium]
MNDLKKQFAKNVTIKNELGLHARPAAMIAELASQAESNVWLIKNDQQVDAASIIDILSLACLQGSTITLQVEDPADTEILDQLHELFKSGFGE